MIVTEGGKVEQDFVQDVVWDAIQAGFSLERDGKLQRGRHAANRVGTLRGHLRSHGRFCAFERQCHSHSCCQRVEGLFLGE